ncbi:hypothetical protein OIU84_008033 [Salix udensis]|uniref:Wall-associated receptor kinase C-terminal domain-containing protein n=1 Tax=Salix udensis TaxID=889485 RepID=A0AAD6JVN1_9ROSI|nr:hypothetical protein OIU84_008033 [Salix udensis]
MAIQVSISPAITKGQHSRFPMMFISLMISLYANNSLLVANAAAFEETCPTPLRNISLDRTPFTISSGYHNFSLLYNCTSKPKNNTSVYALSCATDSTHFSFAGFHLEEIEKNSSYPLNSCQDFVSAPIHTGEDIATSLNTTDYSEVLKMGFRMSWTAHNCSACETSGGRGGFEKWNWFERGQEGCHRSWGIFWYSSHNARSLLLLVPPQEKAI